MSEKIIINNMNNQKNIKSNNIKLLPSTSDKNVKKITEYQRFLTVGLRKFSENKNLACFVFFVFFVFFVCLLCLECLMRLARLVRLVCLLCFVLLLCLVFLVCFTHEKKNEKISNSFEKIKKT